MEGEKHIMADVFIKALFTNLIGGGGAVSGHSYDTLPDDDDIALTTSTTDNALGAYAEVASTVGSADVWFYGCAISAISAALDGKFTFATGAASSESIFGVFPATRLDIGTAANTGNTGGDDTIITVPFPVRIPNGTRTSAAFKAGGTTGFTANVVTMHATGLAG